MNRVEAYEWMTKYRLGQVENEFSSFDCEVPDCICNFGNKADYILHLNFGRHGRMGDRDSDMKRKMNKYFSRRERAKQDMYREQAQSKL